MLIDNYKEVEITKIVSYYKIYFKYDGSDYLLKLCEDDYDYEVRLYERVFNRGKLVRVECISSSSYANSIIDTIRLKNGIKDNRLPSSYVHNQIDTKYFVIKLRLLDLITVSPDLKDEINSVMKKVDKNKAMIDSLNSVISEIREQNLRLMEFR